MRLISVAIIIIFFGCSLTNHSQKIRSQEIQSNKILRNLIRANEINGQIILNDFDDSKIDSFVGVYVKKPIVQTYTIDSIYYFYFGDFTYKILAQSEFDKGLIYLEVDKNGNHNIYYEFGGYVLDVSNVKVEDKKNNLLLTFEIDSWSSTMPDTIKQFIKIVTNKNSIDFKIWNKFDKKDKWKSIITN